MRKFFLGIILVIFCFNFSYSKTFVNDIEFSENKNKLPSYIKNRIVGDDVFDTKSKVAAAKYYERVVSEISNDFVSLSRLTLIYSYREVPEISLYYGTNALNVYKSLPPENKERIYTINYIELLTGLSLTYSLLMNEPMAYTYLDEAKTKLQSLYNFQRDYQKGVNLVNYAENIYKKTFYRLSPKTNTNNLTR
jgi:hypothetical protein